MDDKRVDHVYTTTGSNRLTDDDLTNLIANASRQVGEGYPGYKVMVARNSLALRSLELAEEVRESRDVLTTAQARIAELEEAVHDANGVADANIKRADTAEARIATLEAGRHADRVAGVRKGLEKASDHFIKGKPGNSLDIVMQGIANTILAIDAEAAAREIE